MEVAAWVTIVNQSGATYEDARLKLVAGDVQRATPRPMPAAPQAVHQDCFPPHAQPALVAKFPVPTAGVQRSGDQARRAKGAEPK